MNARLQTTRLVLTPVDEGAVPWLTAHWNHPEVGRYLWDGQPVPVVRVEETVQSSIADFAAHGRGLFLVRMGEAAGPIGVAGLVVMPAVGMPEVLYSVEPSVWGKGVATEAAAACLHHGFGHLGLELILGGVDAANQASTRVLEKLGMSPYRVIHLHGIDVHYHAVERSRFEQVVTGPPPLTRR